jgi:NAD(P)H-hydrate epimerase
MVLAGSINYPGAAGLSGMGAYRVGAGLVTMAVPSIIQSMIAPILPEATWILLPHEMGVISENAFNVVKGELGNYQCLILGPGFGLDEATKNFLSRLFGADDRGQKSQIGFVLKETEQLGEKFQLPPCVIDADGLKLLAKIEKWWKLMPEGSILTPHPGEMSVLTGESVDAIQKNRIEVARKWAKTWNQVIVLKGAFTVIADPQGDVVVIPIAHPALARAGTGDVLTGAIAGFRAQGVSCYESAILGSYVHAKAGEFAADMLGTSASVLAGDVADAIALVLTELEGLNRFDGAR